LRKSDESGRSDESGGLIERVNVPRIRRPADGLGQALQLIREDLALPESFPAEVEREAREAVESAELPELDLTSVEFVTIDPEGATDLDQAVFLERSGDGMRVRYAIADVPAFVRPGGAVDREARERGQTLYAPDGRVPLHPTVISEDAASLLEGRVRAAYVWTFDLDAAANVTDVTLERARVRSRKQYSYTEVQAAIDPHWHDRDAASRRPGTGQPGPTGTADASLQLLKEFGLKRIELERERGGASLNRPDEEVVLEAGRYELVRRSPLPVEEWNAQVSLMTGMQAAGIMLGGGVGILRTMPEPQPEVLEQFRRQVAALGCPWPEGQPYGEYLRSIRRDDPRGLAAIHAATTLFRGAGYTAFDGSTPEHSMQAAVAAPYAHTTAPLRRLVDRFVLVTCEALKAGREVPEWVREALPTLPKIMARSDGVASRLEHASVDAIEAALLSDRVGQVFDAVVIGARANGGGGTIQLTDPVVTASVEGDVEAGHTVRASLATADITTGTVLFRLDGTA
jgi:exoribonuclease R